MPKKRLVLEDLYDVEKILARRVKRGGVEYLVAWEGYGTEADTWEPPEHLPKRFINRYMRFRAELPASFEVCLTDLRDKIARRLLESKGPTFGCEVQCEKAALPEYAEALLRYLGSPRGGEKVKLPQAVLQGRLQGAAAGRHRPGARRLDRRAPSRST